MPRHQFRLPRKAAIAAAEAALKRVEARPNANTAYVASLRSILDYYRKATP